MKKKISVWAVLFMAVVLLFMYLPMLVVVLYSFNANEARNAMAFTGFTFKWYIELFTVTRGVGDAISIHIYGYDHHLHDSSVETEYTAVAG